MHFIEASVGRNVLLFIVWVVAASLVAEQTNVGVAVFVADIASMCGFGSGGAALSPFLRAHLSAAALQSWFFSHCLQMMFQDTLPLCAVSGNALPWNSVGIHVDSLRAYLLRRHLYIAGEGGRLFSSPICQFTVEQDYVFFECDHPPYGEHDPTISF